MNIKDFINEGKQLEETEVIKENEAVKTKVKNKPIYEVILENDSDFVLERKTSTTDKMLVCILSQGLLYFKNAKTNELTSNPSLREIENFMKECPTSQLPTKIKYAIREQGYSTKLSNYFIWACKNLQSAKVLTNKKIFINPNSSTFEHRFDNITPEQINTLIYAFNMVDRIKEYRNLTFYSTERAITTIYDFITTLEKIGVSKDKLTYNLDKLYQIKYPFLDFYRKRAYIVDAVELGNLEFNNFVDYMVRLNTKEMLFIIDGGGGNIGGFSLREYVDYLNMQVQMYGKVKEKYPNNWLTSLQIMKEKFNAWKELHKDERFLNNAHKIRWLEYSDKTYCIVVPTKASDVVDEGAHLGHCVASYVDNIIEGKTNILFMRKIDSPEESLVTLEFKDNTLCQYKGYGDRAVTEEENEFLDKWCKEKKIEKTSRG